MKTKTIVLAALFGFVCIASAEKQSLKQRLGNSKLAQTSTA